MATPNRKGLKGAVLNLIERNGYLLLNTEKTRAKNTWLRSYGIKTVLDVGANEGETAVEFRQMLPDVDVISFEPLADSYAKMRAKLGNESWWKGYNLAAGAENGQTVIHRSAYSLSSSLLPMATAHKEAYPYTAGSTQETIEVAKLDTVIEGLMPKVPFLLKLDVQGFEIPALRGAESVLAHCAVVVVETSFIELYENQLLFGDVYAYLVERGFVYMGAWGQRDSPINGQPFQQDGIFVKRK